MEDGKMTELEKAEKLRTKADVSFAEAKEALDYAGGDILDALIYLEKQGKSTIPAGGGFFSGVGAPSEEYQPTYNREQHTQQEGERFGSMMKRFGAFCLNLLNKGNNNYLDAYRGDEHMFSCPVTALVLLVFFFFWITIPLLVVSLFFGFYYQFRGADLGTESVNRVMNGASDMVEEVKKSFSEGAHKTNGAEE